MERRCRFDVYHQCDVDNFGDVQKKAEGVHVQWRHNIDAMSINITMSTMLTFYTLNKMERTM